MALGIKAAGAGLGLVVTLAALVAVSVLVPMPAQRSETELPSVSDTTRDAPILSPAPLANNTATPAPIAELPEFAQAEDLANTQMEDTPAEEMAEAAKPAPATELPELPAPVLTDAAPIFADAPPASHAAPGDLVALPASADRLVLPAPVPQAGLPALAQLGGGMPDIAPPPAAPEPEAPSAQDPAPQPAPAPGPAQNALPEPEEAPETADPAPMPDVADPARDTVPEADVILPAPTISALPGRPVTGLPGQPLRRSDAELDSPETDFAPRPAEAALDDSALIRNAVLVQPDPGRALMALVLADPGLPMAERLALAARALPFTVALNPLDPTAPEAAAMYLENGKEVFLMASGLPAGATASDVEVTFSTHFATLPQAAGVIDLPRDGFTRNARLMGDVMQVVGREGYGLVTFAGGLGNPDRAAEAAGIRHTQVFRFLDATEESPFTIRRFLDRAVFQGTQMGQVVVYGEASSPGLLQALDMWQSEGRVDQVALVPVSAILLAD